MAHNYLISARDSNSALWAGLAHRLQSLLLREGQSYGAAHIRHRPCRCLAADPGRRLCRAERVGPVRCDHPCGAFVSRPGRAERNLARHVPGARGIVPRCQGRVTIRINDDGTFTATSPTRPEVSGTVGVRGNRVIFQNSKGARTTLMRSGNTLYGVTEDLATEAHVSIRLDKS